MQALKSGKGVTRADLASYAWNETYLMENWPPEIAPRESHGVLGSLCNSESQLLRTGQSTFPELRRLETRFGDNASTDSADRGRISHLFSPRSSSGTLRFSAAVMRFGGFRSSPPVVTNT